MKRKFVVCGKEIEYELTFKKVKNINLRINRNGEVSVSANKRVSVKLIDDFVLSKAEFILKAKEKCTESAGNPQKEYFSETEVKQTILKMCEKAYPYFEAMGIKYPEIRFRKMVSMWGNCRSASRTLTFNTNLKFAPPECIEYVVLHEFTHFLQANHSKLFYLELEKTCPDWKQRRKQLKDIKINS